MELKLRFSGEILNFVKKPMEHPNNTDEERAERILFSINECHESLTCIYEGLVDREFKEAEKKLKEIIIELKLMLRSIEDDDF